jgi:hypothetical protein
LLGERLGGNWAQCVLCVDAHTAARGHHGDRAGAAIECCRLLGVARKFRDSAERADTPRSFDIGHLPGD